MKTFLAEDAFGYTTYFYIVSCYLQIIIAAGKECDDSRVSQQKMAQLKLQPVITSFTITTKHFFQIKKLNPFYKAL